MNLNELMSVSAAKEVLIASLLPLGTLRIPLKEARGRILAETVSSPMPLPPFNNSSMDGFAVRASDIVDARKDFPITLKVISDVPAGQIPDVGIENGETTRITTGAPLPMGADAVIPVEDTDFQYRDPGIPAPRFVIIYRAVKKGEFVRTQGQDVKEGDVILKNNKRLSPQDMGMLAMVGKSDVLVYRQPRIGLLSTGDELLTVDHSIQPGKIFDSNSTTLGALVEKYGGIPILLGISKDRIEDVRQHLDQAVENGVDLIVSSAGVSVGAFDFVKKVVEEEGEVEFWRVNMRPGKPMLFGKYKGTPFIGLPGNPVSAFIGFEVFIRPAIWKLSGLKSQTRTKYKVKILDNIESDGRESYLRAVASHNGEEWVAKLTGHQGSGNLRSLVQANALVLIPAGVKTINAGSDLMAWFMENNHI